MAVIADYSGLPASTGHTILLFGPLALSFNETIFTQVRQTVVDFHGHHWILETIAKLPEYWKSITDNLPRLKLSCGLNQLEDLKDAFQNGTALETPFPLPNTILIPLVIASHLIQYASFLERTSIELDDRLTTLDKYKCDKETVGLCTGLLSAFAVSCAGNKEQFQKYGAAAIRLGMLIGIVVDVQDSSGELERSKSLTAAWNSVEKGEEMLRILKTFPNSYVSVNYDENRATVTTAVSTISKLEQQLRESGIIASEVGLYGRFHAECHRRQLGSILEFCDSHPEFQLPDASELVIPTRSNGGGDFITQGALHYHAVKSILIEPPQWFQTFTAIRAASLKDKNARIFSFGSERCVPPSLMRGLGSQFVYVADLQAPEKNQRLYSDDNIAVVGMSCKVAGADNLEEFWDLLCRGKSQHKEVPKERFGFETVFRDMDSKRKWYGNFIDGHDMFDHKFFKKSPRESATMDPQQRHFLQTSYQAVEQSGYLNTPGRDQRVGCYVGVCACDYENNIACHAPNAFSATGNLQGFIAGKISHYFGWTGPALTIDTACSSSAVAIHQACRSILSGECNAALAGGTHVMTSPLWFQNLAGASFLSLTGQCKPFDAKADGYCRGEGVAAVFLKRLSAAIADGDQVLGVIAATGVQQNQNCTPIFVPNVPSLSDLFRDIITKSRLNPSQISVVEAHGTGTAVGDPAEYDSIRTVLGGPVRAKPLILSSVKGLVGHIECTSGIVSVIKVLLMIRNGKIPPQASFTSINPSIKATPADKITIPTTVQSWDVDFRAALINNYGASGSNASIILTQPPVARVEATVKGSIDIKSPFWFCGLDDQSLRRYSVIFRKFLSHNNTSKKLLSLSNISFNLSRQSNRLLDRGLMFSVRSLEDLETKLKAYEKGDGSVTSTVRPAPRSVILCFGGQVSNFVGLDRQVYESMAILRKHLDNVDAIARSLGVGSIFPGIFQCAPIQDTVKLQTMLFAMQYACACSWIDSGIRPVAVVGHSFGELTSLCISQALSLEDSVKMVVNRATIIRDAWGNDKGAMMAIEADLSDIKKLLTESIKACRSETPATIACYNGPRSFTIAGSTAAIDAVAETVSKNPVFSALRTKRLNVTNAFHCALLDPLLERLEQSSQELRFREFTIPMERAVEFPTHEKLTPKFVADHIRSPVFFNHAVQRLAKQYPSCIFLEAGSNSTITNMASRALGNPSSSHFQAINITNENGWNSLTDATLNLWKAGLTVQFWAHHATQTKEYTPLLLPPYQFDQARHWAELKEPPKLTVAPAVTKVESHDNKLPENLLTFIGFQDSKNNLAKFRVNTNIPKYDKLIAGHIIAETAPICPATVQLDLAIEAIRSIRPDLTAAKLEPQILGVENQSPICINPARVVWIELTQEEVTKGASWDFQVFSTDTPNGTTRVAHTTGKIVFRSTDDLALKLEFARFERLVSHSRCLELLQGGEVDEVLQHRNIYKIFAEIVNYGEDYRGLQKLVCRANQSAGHVVKKYNPESWLDAHLADSFCQVGGIWVNCMADRAPADMFIANGIEHWIRSPKLRQDDPRPDSFHVLATHHRPSDRACLTDVFVFNPATGQLIEAICGISYVRIPKVSMSKLLSRLTVVDSQTTSPGTVLASSGPVKVDLFASAQTSHMQPQVTVSAPAPTPPKPLKEKKIKTPKIDVTAKVKAILAELSGLELDEIKDNSELADLGIDSLMGMEMAHEIEAAFKITLPESELMEITDMPDLMKCVHSTLRGSITSVDVSQESGDESDSRSEGTNGFTSSNGMTGISTPAIETESEKNPDDALQPDTGELNLPFATVMEAFNEIKPLTDELIAEYNQTNYVDMVLPIQTEMCIALTLEAFDELGCPLRDAQPGQKFPRISHPKEHSRLVDYLYKMLEHEAMIINIDGNVITRTAISAPSRSSKEVLEDLLVRFPDQNTADKLTFYTGSKLADVLRGKTDGIKLIFGTTEGRDLVSGLYADWPMNRLFYKQMENFLSRLVSKLDMSQGPLKILEMGAGTGGTTRWIVPLLAELNVPVEYTFTDLAPSFVAAARKKFKAYPFMKFRTHDIEKAPSDDLIGSQHVIIASNAVHATHSLCESTRNMRKLLRADGFLMMLEMTGTLYWVDMIFGLFEGWWFFEDGRTHAVTHESRWEKDLQSVGYGHVAWTNGTQPENKLEKLIIAMASGGRYEGLHISPISNNNRPWTDCSARQAVVDRYVRDLTDGFTAAIETPSVSPPRRVPNGKCVLLTGATGSLGSHLLAHLSLLPDVAKVICLNRRTKLDPKERLQQALTTKGIVISKDTMNKVSVFESDLSKPNLGLPVEEYENLLENVTHIIHNAWLMNAKWPVKNFEPQLQIMRNMISLACEISIRLVPETAKVNFQFISSIATVGHWPLWTGTALVPEKEMTIDSVLPTGYGDAKYICELMLDKTLHRHPNRFRAMAVRLGQIAGSSTSGYWNPMEHLPFVIKSSQTLRALPDFGGPLSWTPVNDVAGTLVDLLTLPDETTPYPIYHIDNPVRQPWKEMILVLADALDIPVEGVIPFREWLQRVKDYQPLREGPDGDNPAMLLIDFLDDNFIRMSCGGLLLDTKKTRQHSKTLANLGPVRDDTARLYIKQWKDMGFMD